MPMFYFAFSSTPLADQNWLHGFISTPCLEGGSCAAEESIFVPSSPDYMQL